MSNAQFEVLFDLTQTRSHAFVIASNGVAKPVKNLGWLLRNWKHVTSMGWFQTRRESLDDGIFVARLRDGRIFGTHYASFHVFVGFVNRPVFAGLLVYLYDEEMRQRGSFKVGATPRHADISALAPWAAEHF